MASERAPRLRPLSPGTIANNVSSVEGISDEELIARLYEALAALPPEERKAAVIAIGLDQGAVGAAMELDLDPEDADAVTRNALQLLRGALADVDLDAPAYYGRLEKRRGGADPAI